MAKRMAIMRGIVCGIDDNNLFSLSFTTYTRESNAAMQRISDPKEIAEFVRAYMVSDVKNLDGKPCWVETESDEGGPGELMKLIGPCIIKHGGRLF